MTLRPARRETCLSSRLRGESARLRSHRSSYGINLLPQYREIRSQNHPDLEGFFPTRKGSEQRYPIVLRAANKHGRPARSNRPRMSKFKPLEAFIVQFLTHNAQRRPRRRPQPPCADLFVAVQTNPVTAVLDARQCRADFAKRLRLPIALYRDAVALRQLPSQLHTLSREKSSEAVDVAFSHFCRR